MSEKEVKLKWLKVTKHNGAVHVNPNTPHKKTFLEKQNALLTEAMKMKIEEVEMTVQEARAIEPYDKNHVPPTQDEVKAFIDEIDNKDKLLSEKDAEIEELKKQLAAKNSKKNSATV